MDKKTINRTEPDREVRVWPVEGLATETREGAGDGELPVITGHAAVFNRQTEIWPGFYEIVKPGAFRDAINEDDVRALVNHHPNLILGRNRAQPTPTLELREDDTGLFVRIMPPNTQAGRDIVVSIDRGDISGMSFAFRAQKTEYEYIGDKEEEILRTLVKVRLFDVAPVTYPQYDSTDISVAERGAAEFRSKHQPQQAKPWRRQALKRRLDLLNLTERR